MREVILSLAGCAFLAGAPPVPVQAASPPHIGVVLKPGTAGPDGRIGEVAVTLTLSDVRSGAGDTLLQLPFVSDNVDTVATTLGNFQASDDRSSLRLVVEDDAPSATGASRRWVLGRAVEGDVVVSYEAPVGNTTGSRGAAPPIEFRSEDYGISAGGAIFLAMPDDDLPRRFSLHWDLSAMPADAVAISSYGIGDVEVAALPPDRFTNSYFMAGPIGHYPDAGAGRGFFGGWQGTPPFDAKALMRWGEHLYKWYGNFFRPPKAEPFGVFMRRNPVNPGGGMSLGHSFIVTYGETTEAEPLHLTLAHEMFHTFVGSLDAPQGLESSWFGEGLAVYYQRLLPLRAGQLSPEDFLNDLNSTAGRYYTDALIGTPNDRIAALFWEDTRVRVLPYDRGSMYFARLDHRIRIASGGRRSLDDLLLAMLELRRSGRPMDQAAWVRLVTAELGASGKEAFDEMLGGAVILPSSDAFGPCFARTRKPLRRYQLGFEPKVLTENPRIVRGLLPESAAARAGLRNGDEILKPVGQDAIQGEQDAWLTLQIRREGRTFQLRYRPRGETVQAWQWERRQGVPDSACAY